MKNYIFIMLLVVLSCKEQPQNNPTKQTVDKINDASVDSISKDSSVEKKYVNATSGLNYRESPKGTVLGKFVNNQELIILKHTGILEEIKDDNTQIKGEWVGVALKKDTVYVFDAFLGATKKETGIWSKFPLKQSPLLDSTNYDNLKKTTVLNNAEITQMQLKTIYPNFNKAGYDFRFMPGYSLHLSKEYKTMVLVVYGDTEMESVLINYNQNNKIIDSRIISYDENAEGWTRQTSEIKNNCITSIYALYTEPPQIDTTLYHINRFGEINKINTKFTNNIRPKKPIKLHANYTDTIQFLSYNDDADYAFIKGRKNNKPVTLLYHIDDTVVKNLKTNDFIRIEWKMDSIYIAGDGETLEFSEFLINAKKIQQP